MVKMTQNQKSFNYLTYTYGFIIDLTLQAHERHTPGRGHANPQAYQRYKEKLHGNEERQEEILNKG